MYVLNNIFSSSCEEDPVDFDSFNLMEMYEESECGVINYGFV